MANAEVSVDIYRADGNTPLEYHDIMVGTKLAIVIESDEILEFWYVDLALEDANMNYAVLSARDYNESTLEYAGSHLEAAGENAWVQEWVETGISGFQMRSGSTDFNLTTGRWFIIDYEAVYLGECYVNYYQDHLLSDTIHFNHVRTRDWVNNYIVDLADFALLASYWQESCTIPNGCEGTDLDDSGKVDLTDLMLLSDYWLEKTN